jgi:Sulfotransferase domain
MSRVTRVVRRATSPLRALPDFLIIGAQRAGSSSLFAYVCAHPSVAEPTHKEIHFFDNNWFRGLDWYRRYFPLRARMGGRITGEASPYYLFHPAAPGRVAETLPDVRLIAVLRDPVERAYSAYQLARRQGHETLEFEEALAREVERLAGEEERILADPRYASLAHRRFSYRTRGLYAEQLERWYERFPREQLLVVRSEDLFAEPEATLQTVFAFLGLEAWSAAEYPALNQRPYSGMSDEARASLGAAYAEPNRRLEALVGRELGWQGSPAESTARYS